MKLPYDREWIRNDQILCYRFSDLARVMMDSWYNDVVEVYRAWPDRQPLLMLIEARMARPNVSEHVIRRVSEASSVRPRVSGRTAFLIADPLLVQGLAALLRARLPLGTRQRRVFANEHEAVEWLLEAAL